MRRRRWLGCCGGDRRLRLGLGFRPAGQLAQLAIVHVAGELLLGLHVDAVIDGGCLGEDSSVLAARGARRAGSDIDYVAPPSSLIYFRGLENKLPGMDAQHGIIPGVGNTNIGPVIRFEPR